MSGFFALGKVEQSKGARSGVQAEVDLALRFASDLATLAALSRSDWNVGDLLCGREPATVYLTFPPTQKGPDPGGAVGAAGSVFGHDPSPAQGGRRAG